MLLLEDDSSFRAILSDYLTEAGYTVVPVEDGGEGVREVLARDFAVVICDLMMPGLPGDMFYRAIEKIRPALCQRFIFMTGHRSGSSAEDFIRKVDAFVLRKPFSMSDLLDSVALAEVRRTFHSVFEGDPVRQDAAVDCRPVNYFLARAGPRLQPSEVLRILARAKDHAGPGGQSAAPPEAGPESGGRGRSRALAFAGLVVFPALLASLWIWHEDLRARADAASAQRQRIEAEWSVTSRTLQEAIARGPKIQMTRAQLAGIAADRAEPRWSPALRSVAGCAGQGIQVREVQAREKAGDEKVWTLIVVGVATGSAPRAAADRYRADLQRELHQIFPGGASIRVERFEELPVQSSAKPGDQSGAFTIVATIHPGENTGTGSKEGA